VAAVSGGEGPFIKAGLEVVGLHAGPPRLPSTRVTGALLAELRELFAASGVPGLAQPRERLVPQPV
jgi:hypothetical protein